ncbi:MAG: Smr/MutS family protein [Proteobacteria bacterium]|nr:Smr/MutS family protein [Pseudomonadota bacterium]
MQRDDSIYRFFTDLPIHVKPLEFNIPLTREDDNSVFSEAMKDVRKPNYRINRVDKELHLHCIILTNGENVKNCLRETLQDDYTFTVSNLPEYMEGYIEGINPFIMEKLRSGDFSIQKTLDLHGYDTKTAQIAFEVFIKEAVLSGKHCVRVIHGRGLKSRNAPVLKENLKTWIIKAMYRKWIIAFSSCRMCDGGPGATYILLKKRPKKSKLHIIG